MPYSCTFQPKVGWFTNDVEVTAKDPQISGPKAEEKHTFTSYGSWVAGFLNLFGAQLKEIAIIDPITQKRKFHYVKSKEIEKCENQFFEQGMKIAFASAIETLEKQAKIKEIPSSVHRDDDMLG